MPTIASLGANRNYIRSSMLGCYCSEHRGTYLHLPEPGFFNLSTIHAQHPCRIEFHFTVGRHTPSETVIRFALLSGLQSESFFLRNVRKVLSRSPQRTSDFSEWVQQEYERTSSRTPGAAIVLENLELSLSRAKYCSQHDKKNIPLYSQIYLRQVNTSVNA